MPERLDRLRARLREEALRRNVSPRDVDLLLADHLGRSPSYVIAHGEIRVDPREVEALFARRVAGEPLQYIRGKSEFFGREFLVDSRVLIPRPETELLVEAAIARAGRGARVVDLGTGSGCIAITIERERPDLEVLGIDVSLGALAVARRNCQSHGSDVRLAAGDLFDGLRSPFDVVVSNPPYIPEADVEELAVEVRDHEPRAALTPGPAGTEVVERIFRGAGRALVIMEIGYGQAAAVRALAERCGRRVDAIVPDLAAIPRVVVSSPA